MLDERAKRSLAHLNATKKAYQQHAARCSRCCFDEASTSCIMGMVFWDEMNKAEALFQYAAKHPACENCND